MDKGTAIGLGLALVSILGAAVVAWTLSVLLWILALWKASHAERWRIPIAARLADRFVKAPGIRSGPSGD